MENVSSTNKQLELTLPAMGYLSETRKWTLFFSILGFVFIGLMVIVFLFFNPMRTAMMASGMPFARVGMGIGVIVMLIILALYFFPIYFLYKFSYHSKLALDQHDDHQMTEAMRFLKYHYKFLGILTIIFLSIYILIFGIAAMFGGLMHMGMS